MHKSFILSEICNWINWPMRVDIFHKNANVWQMVSGHFSTEVNFWKWNVMGCRTRWVAILKDTYKTYEGYSQILSSNFAWVSHGHLPLVM